jgi:hypothetical protein
VGNRNPILWSQAIGLTFQLHPDAPPKPKAPRIFRSEGPLVLLKSSRPLRFMRGRIDRLRRWCPELELSFHFPCRHLDYTVLHRKVKREVLDMAEAVWLSPGCYVVFVAGFLVKLSTFSTSASSAISTPCTMRQKCPSSVIPHLGFCCRFLSVAVSTEDLALGQFFIPIYP